MKRFFIPMAILLCCATAVMAVTYKGMYNVGWKNVSTTTAVRLASSLCSIGDISLSNPTTSTAVFDLFQTTATPGTARLPIRTIVVPAAKTETVNIGLTNVRDFSVALSTSSAATVSEHYIYYEYKTQ